MILYVDVDASRARVGLIGADRIEWTECPPRELSSCLGKAASGIGRRRPTAVAVPLTGEGRAPTWSGVRAMTAVANALAFAWGVPAVDAAVPSDADDAAVLAAVKAAAKGASKDARVRATYDGLPNITSPKR